MDKPKRRKDKYNPYTLEVNHILVFTNSHGNKEIIKLTDDLYNLFNSFELQDLKFLNEYDRHTEHLELSDSTLFKRTIGQYESLEDKVLNKITYEKILEEIEALPDLQKRRIKMYYFYDFTLREIAVLENCSIQSIKDSIDIGLQKISQKMKI